MMFKNFKVSISQIRKKTAYTVILSCLINLSYTVCLSNTFRCAKYDCLYTTALSRNTFFFFCKSGVTLKLVGLVLVLCIVFVSFVCFL